jgi:hypothetical protein
MKNVSYVFDGDVLRQAEECDEGRRWVSRGVGVDVKRTGWGGVEGLAGYAFRLVP